jgi:hypothetical protein
VNDTYVNEVHTIDLIVNTATDEDRLKELSDEVVRILGATVITGATYQRVKKRQNISDKKTFNFQELLKVDIREHMKSSASAYGAGATGDFTITGDLIVGGDDIKDSSSATVISFNGAGAIDTLAAPHALLTDTTLTGAQLEDLLMFGSANAAWVPCIFQVESPKSEVYGAYSIRNVGANDQNLSYVLPLPTNKGGLKLYISGIRVGIIGANGTNFITRMRVYGLVYNTVTTLDDDTTDYNSAQLVDESFAAVDCSSHNQIVVQLDTTVANAGALNIVFVELECYYT